MPWQSKWRAVRTIETKPHYVAVVESLTTRTTGILKTHPVWARRTEDSYYGEFRLSIARETIALERLHAAGAAVAQPLDGNLADFHTHGVVLFVVMEYIPGRELSTSKTTPELIERIAAIVHLAHSVGVAHRDLSPRNVMMRPNGEPVIIDWSGGVLRDTRGTPIPPTSDAGWAEAVRGDLLSLENLPKTLECEFGAKMA